MEISVETKSLGLLRNFQPILRRRSLIIICNLLPHLILIMLFITDRPTDYL